MHETGKIEPDHPGELIRRAKIIRLPLATIAREIEADPHTVANLAKSGRRVQHRTVRAVDRIVTAHELKLRDHLLQLHGLPEKVA